MYYLALIVGVVLALLIGCQETDEECELKEVSAMDVFEFLTETASTLPFAHEILMEMRFAEVVFLLQQAKEQSNAEMYLIGFKFANLLYTGNHCTKYAKIWPSSLSGGIVLQKLTRQSTSSYS